MTEYYLVGAYNELPVYFSTKQGIMLGSRMDELKSPTPIENLEIIRNLGGLNGIERIVSNYQKSERLEAKKNERK